LKWQRVISRYTVSALSPKKLVGATIVSFQVDGAGEMAPNGAGKTENGTKGKKVRRWK
jgi:hypothetical protein